MALMLVMTGVLSYPLTAAAEEGADKPGAEEVSANDASYEADDALEDVSSEAEPEDTVQEDALEEDEDILEGQIAPVQTPTVLQAVKEADSGCQALPPDVKSLSCSTTTNAQGNWTFSGVFTPVTGAGEYELYFGAMEGDGAIYEKGIFTLPTSALTPSGDDVSFSIAPYWYGSYAPVAGETIYVALEAYVSTVTGSGTKMLSTGWQELNELTIGGEPAEDKNKLTVRFVNQNNMSIASAHIEFLDQGDAYSVDIPAVEGYDCQYASSKVEGTMGNEDVTVNVPYQGKEVALSIAYNYSNGQQAHAHVNATLRVGDSYRYPSPEIDLYNATPEVVEGYATAADVAEGISAQVVYAKDKFILEVQYLLYDGENNDQSVKATETSWVEAGSPYKVEFLSLEGYSRVDDQGDYRQEADDEKIYEEGTMPSAKKVIKFYYRAGTTHIKLSFVDEDGREIMVNGYETDQRKDRDFVMEAPVDPYGCELRDSLFDGRYVRISMYDFKDKTDYTHTFKYYKKYKDTVHYRYADPAKGEEEVFPDDVYNRNATDYMQVPEKSGYVSSRSYIRLKDTDQNQNLDTTVYYAPCTVAKGRVVSEGVPYKVFVNDSGRDPFNPADRYDLTLTPLWQWNIDRDPDQTWGSAGWNGSVDVYIDGQFYQTVTSTVSSYPETEDLKYLRGVTFTVNTGSDLIPASGKFTLTTYEKRQDIYVKTDFNVDIGWAMGASIPSDRFVSLASAVTKDTANSTPSEAKFTWSLDSSTYTVGKGRLKEKTGDTADGFVISSGSGTYTDEPGSNGTTVYTATLNSGGCYTPTTRSFEFYAPMGYQQAEGFPTENKWAKATGSATVGGQTEEEQEYTTSNQSARIEYNGFDSYHSEIKFHAYWSTTKCVYETWPAHQALENHVDARECRTYAGYGNSGTVVNAATGKKIGTAYLTRYGTNDGDYEASISIYPSAVLENYIETGSSSLSYKVYFRTGGFQVVTDGGTTPVGEVVDSLNVSYTWHPEGNSAGGYWTNSLGGDGTDHGWSSALKNDWTVISGSYSADCSSITTGTLFPNDCTIGRDGSFSLAWDLGSVGSKIRSNDGRAHFVNKLYASETNIVKAADGLSGQGVYNGLKNAGYVGYESGWEGCPGSTAWSTSGVGMLDELPNTFKQSGKFLKGGYQSDYNKYQSFTGGATANVLINMAGWYADANETDGEGQVTTYGAVHFFLGSVSGNVQISGKRTLPVVSNIQVTKDDVKVIKEKDKDPRITLDLEWTHTITQAEDLEEFRIDPQGAADSDELGAETAESVDEHPLADNDMAIEITPIGYEDANGGSMLFDSTYYIESFEKTASGCRLKVKNLQYMDKTRLPDGFDVEIKYLYTDPSDPYNQTTIKTYNHRIMLEKDKAQSEVLFQIDDEGNAVVRVSDQESLGSLKVDMYNNSGQLVKNGTVTGYSGENAIYQYNDDIKGVWLENDSFYGKSKTKWFKLNVENVSKENRAKYYVIIHGYDYDRNPFDEEVKHYATAENFVTVERASVNNGVFRIAYKLNLPEEGIGNSDSYDATASSFNIVSRDGKPDYVITKEMELPRSYLSPCSTREFAHAEQAKDNKTSTALIFFDEEKATDLLGDELQAKVSVAMPGYMSTKANLTLKSEKLTIEEQPLLSLTSASLDMMGNVKLAGSFDPNTFTIGWSTTLKFNVICPDGYIWSIDLDRYDRSFTYNNTAGTFSYDGKLCDVIRGSQAMGHYSIKDFVKLKGRPFKASASAVLSSGKLDSAQIPLNYGGNLKATANMISTATYNGGSYLKASIPSGWLEYGLHIDALVEQALDAGQGLLIVSDDNYSIAFAPASLASFAQAENTILNIYNLTSAQPDNVKKSGLSPAGVYDFAISNPFDGQVEVGLPTGTIPYGKTLAVYYVDDNGSKTNMSARVVTQSGLSKAVYNTTHNSVYVVVYEGGSNTGGNNGGNNNNNQNNQPASGTTVTDGTSQASYVVTSDAGETPEVSYKESSNSSAKKVEVPATVKVNGVDYKVTSVEEGAFKNNKTVTEVKIGKNVETIEKSAFEGCTSLTKITIPAAVTTIGDKAFSGDKRLKSVSVGSNVTSIGAQAFAGCTSLTKMTLPKNVAKIGGNAFKNCKKMKTLIIKSTKLTAKSVKKNAFKGLTKKTTIKVPKSKLKAYKALFKKKGLSGKVKVKKI
ncbi:MAG: leucine-rich repeat protein [Lachnospiraceae bacterium]|nr:leucine-rich repeat protein [Lachnospiraceae bacterium]